MTRDRAQLTLNFEPSLPERWPTLREFVWHCVDNHLKPAKTIAADMDLSPSTLSRKLAPSEADTQRFNCDDLERYMQATGDTAPIEYLAAKFMQGTDARKALAIARVETLAAELDRTLKLLKGDAK
ncbi:MAG: phage regulatory CII family protein [Sinimarinibacterium sp.]|jgi:hypothetical protein